MLTIQLTTDACAGQDNEVRYVEHVQAIVTARVTRRGDMTINMTSPSGTESILLAKRPFDDDSEQGTNSWRMPSERFYQRKKTSLSVLL